MPAPRSNCSVRTRFAISQINSRAAWQLRLTMPPREAERTSAPICTTTKTATRRRRSRRILEHQGNEGNRNDQLGEAREMIAVDIRPEGDAAKPKFTEPIEFSVEREVLQDAEQADREAEGHDEPEEGFPIAGGSKRLRGEEQKHGIGEQQLQFDARGKG